MALSQALGTKVSVGNIELRLPSRIIVDNLCVPDQSGKDMLRANRVSVSIDLMPLLDGQIRISSAQLFGMKANLYTNPSRHGTGEELNCQFLIDSLKSKDTLNTTPLDLRITSLIIRNSAVSFHRNTVPFPPRDIFSPSHLNITNLSSHIILHHLTDDTLDVNVKRMHLQEQSGLSLRHLSFSLLATPRNISVTNLSLRLPQSDVTARHASFAYTLGAQDSSLSSFLHQLHLTANITPADLAFLNKDLAKDHNTYSATLTSEGTHLSTKSHLNLRSASSEVSGSISATINNLLTSPNGNVNIDDLHLSEQMLRNISAGYGANLPQQVLALGNIGINGKATFNASLAGSKVKNLQSSIFNLQCSTSKAGRAELNGEYNNGSLSAHLVTPGLNLSQITGDKTLGNLSCDVRLNTQNVNNLKQNTQLSGTIQEITYNNYTYHNVRADGKLVGNILSGKLDIDDRNIMLRADGSADLANKNIISADIDVQNFSPSRLHLTNALGDTPINARLNVSPTNVSLTSDIADINMQGTNINLAALPGDLMHIVNSTLTPLNSPVTSRNSPVTPRNSSLTPRNSFTLDARLKDPSILKSFLPSSIEIPEEATLLGSINAPSSSADLTLSVPTLLVSDQKFSGTTLHLQLPTTQSSNLTLTTDFMDQNGPVALTLQCEGKEDHLLSLLTWDNQRTNPFKGSLTTKTQFYTTQRGTAFRISIPESHFQVGDSLWTVQSPQIKYENGTIGINRLYIGSNTQNVQLDGIASASPADSLTCQLSNVDISYILNLVNFHSVEFDGMASGTLSAKAVLGDVMAGGHLDVAHFLFEKGNLGNLHLDADYDMQTKRIMLDGICDDSPAQAATVLNGYVEPVPGAIELNIQAVNSRLEFVETFCSSFMKDCTMRGTGNVRLFGPFSNINLEGKLAVDGAFTLSSTNCRYTLPGDTVTFVPDDILFHDAVLKDKFGNTATLTGGVHHQHLTRMSYDLYATTSRLLAYDFPQLQPEENFCGYAIINGDVGINGKGNELTITCDATPLANTYLTYNASSPDAIRTGDIITWRSAENSTASSLPLTPLNSPIAPVDERTNIHMNFFVHANPDARLHIIMDDITGDYIDLFGNGDLRVNYYNKGGLDIFGNYTTDHGLYKMTIQNIIRRDFTFRKGGTITFGGDPYDALLNMQALYSLNSVPLADLNIGTTLTANNVPVNCLMNITGTPGKPSVAFDLDLPSLSTDARQMINSVINSAEEMNQQVLYLLAIGRFYAPSNVGTASSRDGYERDVSQSSLAVQSFLSGTLTQQFNNMMSGVMSNLLGSSNTFTFGANIAPGNEGFSNAEYEGLLSGRLFNNRLLFNGQFGYRDNIKTNSQSFIGDFTVQYLLTKSGVISLKVYNQTNDRYFTRNSLNTQGIGIVFQKEFGK